MVTVNNCSSRRLGPWPMSACWTRRRIKSIRQVVAILRARLSLRRGEPLRLSSHGRGGLRNRFQRSAAAHAARLRQPLSRGCARRVAGVSPEYPLGMAGYPALVVSGGGDAFQHGCRLFSLSGDVRSGNRFNRGNSGGEEGRAGIRHVPRRWQRSATAGRPNGLVIFGEDLAVPQGLMLASSRWRRYSSAIRHGMPSVAHDGCRADRHCGRAIEIRRCRLGRAHRPVLEQQLLD